jgi:hypothetical protein
MSFQITEAFAQQFADNFRHVAQQSVSRLESAVMVESGIRGLSKSVNRMGRRTAQQRTTRHGDTPLNDQPHSTRFIDLGDWEDGDMLDDQDKIRMLADPTSDYVKAMVAGLNRAKDQVIINAALGAARTAPTAIGGATATVALPSSQRILVGGTGLTKAKIFQAKRFFRRAEADEENGEELYFVYNASALADVLADTQLTSADFQTVQMIQNGSLRGKWMGFTWVPSELLPIVSTTRTCFAFAKSGLSLGIGEDIVTEIGKDPSKAFNVRIYAKMSIGAVRVEEEKVVAVEVLDN